MRARHIDPVAALGVFAATVCCGHWAQSAARPRLDVFLWLPQMDGRATERNTHQRRNVWNSKTSSQAAADYIHVTNPPPSHSAVLTGTVLTQFSRARTGGVIVCPWVSLYSLKAIFESRNPKPDLLHNRRTSASPYSGDKSCGYMSGFSASAALLKAFFVSGISLADMASAKA